MKTVTVHEAKTHLSRLLREVEAGEEIIIRRGNKTVARLSAAETGAPRPRHTPGAWAHIKLSEETLDALADPLPEELVELMEGAPAWVDDLKE
ncbi:MULTISPECIES: type II toxin-antitoxin system Phd/YefM family antitoxin [Marinicauda]|jgi:prevent-host-death family protein|uniref:type II toxin-antitoxin system Phd/YefM family antitoxin n=1 Tax=Marinicauda TaxID=1649466 RepID=UPI0022E88CC5|nr:type II toxin-antitoxin system prevent-host-death family antitoxin [Marinicauda sp. Alg238-R41]